MHLAEVDLVKHLEEQRSVGCSGAHQVSFGHVLVMSRPSSGTFPNQSACRGTVAVQDRRPRGDIQAQCCADAQARA